MMEDPNNTQVQEAPPMNSPAYTVLPNGQVQMTMVLHPSQIPPNFVQQQQQQQPLPPNSYPPSYPSSPSPSPNSYPPPQYSPPQYGAPPPQYGAPPQAYPPQMYTHPAYAAPAPYPAVVVQPAYSQSKDGLAVTVLVCYIVGIFTFLPYVVSIICSFIIAGKNYLEGGKKAAVIVLATLELISWLLCATMSWYHTYHCDYDYYDNYYSSYRYYDYCYYIYVGWVFIVVWFLCSLVFGIARVVLVWQYSKPRAV